MPLNNPPTSLIPKVKLETRVHDAASGNVSYTGYGFQPSGLIIIAVGGGRGSIGSSEPALAGQCHANEGSVIKSYEYIVYAGPTTTAFQRAVVASYDADGFTLTWGKGLTGCGTSINLHVFAFK